MPRSKPTCAGFWPAAPAEPGVLRAGPARPRPLPHDPFKAVVAPRPIGWISTLDAAGTPNLAPYSFFNAVADSPPIVMFSSAGMKDSASHALDRGEFVWNLATYDLREAMNQSSAVLPRGESEFAFAGLESAPSRLVGSTAGRRDVRSRWSAS